MNKGIEIINKRPFIFLTDTNGKRWPGLATPGNFASRAWIESQEKFDEIVGRSFSWYCVDDSQHYCDDKSKFELLSDLDIHDLLAKHPEVLSTCIRRGYIKECS